MDGMRMDRMDEMRMDGMRMDGMRMNEMKVCVSTQQCRNSCKRRVLVDFNCNYNRP